eukprot:Skav232646  [mRNA]  locus=scaffold2334:54282:58650:- [translate_table: standard]
MAIQTEREANVLNHLKKQWWLLHRLTKYRDVNKERNEKLFSLQPASVFHVLEKVAVWASVCLMRFDNLYLPESFIQAHLTGFQSLARQVATQPKEVAVEKGRQRCPGCIGSQPRFLVKLVSWDSDFFRWMDKSKARSGEALARIAALLIMLMLNDQEVRANTIWHWSHSLKPEKKLEMIRTVENRAGSALPVSVLRLRKKVTFPSIWSTWEEAVQDAHREVSADEREQYRTFVLPIRRPYAEEESRLKALQEELRSIDVEQLENRGTSKGDTGKKVVEIISKAQTDAQRLLKLSEDFQRHEITPNFLLRLQRRRNTWVITTLRTTVRSVTQRGATSAYLQRQLNRPSYNNKLVQAAISHGSGARILATIQVPYGLRSIFAGGAKHSARSAVSTRRVEWGVVVAGDATVGAQRCWDRPQRLEMDAEVEVVDTVSSDLDWDEIGGVVSWSHPSSRSQVEFYERLGAVVGAPWGPGDGLMLKPWIK